MHPIIEIHNIGKKFKISHRDAPYLSLRDSIISYIKNPAQLFKNTDEEFWALSDISFNVMPGESIGIIGKNGAGKSTLLKILSRITPPTKGYIKLYGRVASLLEVGTGFHPELTGRENIYFNGAILGMKRKEISKKFDEIVSFAGVEKFVDTPLKHYSNGMQLRLAFAVAAFLEAEILMVDEVLAVGDAEFQKKCIGKMEEVTKSEGRTVLFVSHNMATIRSFCKKGLYLEKGTSEGLTDVEYAIQKYLNFNQNLAVASFYNDTYYKKTEARILEVELCNIHHQRTNTFYLHDSILIKLKYEVLSAKNVMPNFLLFNQYGIKVMIGTDAKDDFRSEKKNKPGIYQTTFIIPSYLLNPNDYYFHVALDAPIHSACYDVKMNVLQFSVIDEMNEKSLQRGLITKHYPDVSVWPAIDAYTELIQKYD